VTTRDDITQAIINLLPPGQQLTVAEATKRWYRNLRAEGGCRLTDVGYATCRTLDIESWSIALENIKQLRVNKSMLLALDRKITYPYYIDFAKKQLVMFSSREAMLATLYGDLQKFLENYG
jgi:hypothetical protein